MGSLEEYLRAENVDYPHLPNLTLDGAVDIINFVNSYISRNKFSACRLIKNYGKRSATDILTYREVNYRGPCLDLGCLVFSLMKERKFEGLTFKVYRFKGFSMQSLLDIGFCVGFRYGGDDFNINMGANACYLTKDNTEKTKSKLIFERESSSIDFNENSFYDYMPKLSYLHFKFLKLKYGTIAVTLAGTAPASKPPLSIKY
ncbi:MAG: hypothetical protein AABY09_04240 [Nanoarchaeota archaeon]